MGKRTKIYSAAVCDPDPGPGGYAAVLIKPSGEHREISGGFVVTTGDRMELFAIILALESLDGLRDVTIVSDAPKVVDSVTSGEVERWRCRDWEHRDGQAVRDADLWKRLLSLRQQHQVRLQGSQRYAWDPGHRRADALAVEALSRPLPPDYGYRPSLENTAEDWDDSDSHRDHFWKPQIQPECHTCHVPLYKQAPRKTKMERGEKYYYAYHLVCPLCGKKRKDEAAKCYIRITNMLYPDEPPDESRIDTGWFTPDHSY